MSDFKGSSEVARIRHRTKFQLAPLVDLLLIIVFAQFMEVRTTIRDDTIAMQQQVDAADQRSDRLQSEQSKIRQQQELERERMGKAINTIAKIFELPDEQVQQFSINGSTDVAEVLSQVAEQAKFLSEDSPEKVVRFLVGHQELLKRAEIWNLHVGADRKATLSGADQLIKFGLERQGQDARTNEFEEALFAAYKQLPQPKELVVILVSYSPEAVAGVYQPMIDATPRAVERMRSDDSTTRFEYTVLGATEAP